MAKIKITPELMADALFPNCRVEIVDASFLDRWVELEIKGNDVPDAEEVIAIFTKRTPITVEFKPYES